MNSLINKEATMQVSQQDDHITHAVIGEEETISMGMSEDASLMHILSSSLYTYPKLAAVREVICNGWDGHIIGNKLDTPLEISIREGRFRVRDFGPGIPHDKIGPIYGTYGNSTKRHDGKQTGGFGLGSKAPFAYVDNFEVISCHEGTKTIYRVSKSAAEKGGKPSIKKIADMPTAESGITVTFAVNPQDEMEFRDLIHEVIILGGIKAKFNGSDEEISVLPLAESPTGYIINSVKGTILNRINLRYGNVVYPVPMNKTFEAEWNVVLGTMNKLWASSNIIFLAQPDSVSIAPNRESLNFTDGTVQTIKALLGKFTPDDLRDVEKHVKQALTSVMNKKISTEKSVADVKAMKSGMYLDMAEYRGAFHSSGVYSYTVRRARLHHLMSEREQRTPEYSAFDKRYARAITTGAFPSTKMAKAFFKAMKKDGSKKRRYGTKSFLQNAIHKALTYPIYKHMATVEKLEVDRLFIGVNKNVEWGEPELVRPHMLDIEHKNHAVTFAKKRGLIVRSKRAAIQFLENRTCDWGDGWYIYITLDKEERRQEARDMFEKLGFEWYESIPEKVKILKEDDPDYVAPVRKAAPKRKGYLTLSQAFDSKNDTFLLSSARENGSVAGLTDPVAWATLENKAHYRNGKIFHDMKEEVCQAIHKLLGDKIAVVTTAQAEVLAAKGIPDVKTYALQYADDKLSASKDFPRYIAFGTSLEVRGYQYDAMARVVRNMLGHAKLMQDLGIRFSISAETEVLLSIFRKNAESMPKSQALAAKIKPTELPKELVNKANRSVWKKYINLEQLHQDFIQLVPDTPECEVPYTILRNLLK